MNKTSSFAKDFCPISIQTMTAQDIDSLVEIDALSNRPSWNRKMFERELELPFSLPLIANINGEPAGFAVAWTIGDGAQLIQLAVAPKYRRQGIANRLMEQLMEQCRQCGCKTMDLELREENLPARKLYEKRGFESVGKRKQFYPDADAVLMQCKL